MLHHEETDDKTLQSLIRKRVIVLGGHKKLKIYGTLSCYSGKKMKKKNRVFFHSEKEARELGYRPCGHCMKSDYRKWKQSN